MIEEAAALGVWCVAEVLEKGAPFCNDILLNQSKLFDLACVLTMVAQVVVRELGLGF